MKFSMPIAQLGIKTRDCQPPSPLRALNYYTSLHLPPPYSNFLSSHSMISTPRSVSLPPWYQLFTEIRHWPRSKKSILDRSILREIFLLATWSVAWKRLALKKDSFPFRMPLWHLTRSSVQRAPQQILDIERSKINEISPIPPPPLIPRATFSVARQETHLCLRREDTFARITFHLFECSYPSFPFFLFPFLNLCGRSSFEERERNYTRAVYTMIVYQVP